MNRLFLSPYNDRAIEIDPDGKRVRSTQKFIPYGVAGVELYTLRRNDLLF